MTIPLLDLYTLSVIFIRVGAIYFALPFFGDSPTPIRIRVLLALATTVCLAPIYGNGFIESLPTSVVEIVLVVLKEILLGVVIGYVARLAFDGILMAASIVGYQMGFGTASLLVPDAQMQMNSFTAFHRILMMLIFFALNMHQAYFYVLAKTFTVVKPGIPKFHEDYLPFFIRLSGDIFIVSLQLASPILVALMFTMAAMGLIARTVPQMNVFTMSFPTSFFVGLLVYLGTFPFMPEWLKLHFSRNQEDMIMSIFGVR